MVYENVEGRHWCDDQKPFHDPVTGLPPSGLTDFDVFEKNPFLGDFLPPNNEISLYEGPVLSVEKGQYFYYIKHCPMCGVRLEDEEGR